MSIEVNNIIDYISEYWFNNNVQDCSIDCNIDCNNIIEKLNNNHKNNSNLNNNAFNSKINTSNKKSNNRTNKQKQSNRKINPYYNSYNKPCTNWYPILPKQSNTNNNKGKMQELPQTSRIHDYKARNRLCMLDSFSKPIIKK